MIKIDTAWLLEALEDNDPLVQHFLDTQTGEIRRVNEMFETMKEQKGMQEEMEQDPGRWITIIPVPSRDEFHTMETFVSDVPESEKRRTLEKALAWKNPFSNFRQALRDMPELSEKWFAFHREHMLGAAREWLQESGVDAQLK
jgi:uncharacterized protein UPF0158